MSVPFSASPFASFDRIRIINLPSRVDRKRAVTRDLATLGEKIDGHRTAFHPALRPDDRGGFDSIGTRGCFLSHLAVLREARLDGVSSLLILEDDVAFSSSEIARMGALFENLRSSSWEIFYGGSPVRSRATPISRICPTEAVSLTHFMAFTKRAIERLVPYLEAMLERPAGSLEGGPMHVDGAYSWFRASCPELPALAATPPIAHQRASRTDIHDRQGFDHLPLLRHLLVPARAVKNWLWAQR
jgi:glycosyl transferase family 25